MNREQKRDPKKQLVTLLINEEAASLGRWRQQLEVGMQRPGGKGGQNRAGEEKGTGGGGEGKKRKGVGTGGVESGETTAACLLRSVFTA